MQKYSNYEFIKKSPSSMWSTALIITIMVAFAGSQHVSLRSGGELVSSVLDNCIDMEYSLLNIQSEARSTKNIDAAIYKRVARVFKTHEFVFKLPESIFDHTNIVYNPRSGLNIVSPILEDECNAWPGTEKKLLFPILLLFKLKMKLLMPIFVALIGLKATKALILSKLAIVIVLGFIIYQLLGKAGMPMPLSMMPAPTEPPAPMYGAPGPSTAPPSSYEPGWEPNQGGPYQRIWSPSNNDPQSLSYSAYHPGLSTSGTSTSRP
ncbi:hypothetical protein NQ318_017228 [Aromia moschata]|uniref:Osiris 20 n=1 Tax=Aromia moschata TaxID=1265417 RepID=A0AAV8YNU8_9CUCU|nr:hypothetical protein NQ318_017228 [Aromia moschata]